MLTTGAAPPAAVIEGMEGLFVVSRPVLRRRMIGRVRNQRSPSLPRAET